MGTVSTDPGTKICPVPADAIAEVGESKNEDTSKKRDDGKESEWDEERANAGKTYMEVSSHDMYDLHTVPSISLKALIDRYAPRSSLSSHGTYKLCLPECSY